MSNLKTWKLISLLCFITLLFGCESRQEQTQKAMQQQIISVGQDVSDLGKALDNGNIRNARLLTEYARVLKSQKPELTPIAELVAQDATRKGPLYQSLVSRLDDIKKEPVTLDNADQLFARLDNIQEASSISIFNDALTDPINVLADMSDGRLARVGAISKAAESRANASSDYGAGSQFVGNPNYGSWQTNSSGTSFWAWYGQYRLFSDLIGAVEYGHWSRHRNYSYYNDYGRSRYTSPKQYKYQQAVDTNTRKSFQRQGKKFTSPYAKKRTGASSLSRSSYTPTRTKSSYAKSSRSSGSGSVRNSTSRTSRGISRGK